MDWEPNLTRDDVRRELEALGITNGVDRSELLEILRNAYSEVWEPSKHQQYDHETALLHAAAEAAEFLQREVRRVSHSALWTVAVTIRHYDDDRFLADVNMTVEKLRRIVDMAEGIDIDGQVFYGYREQMNGNSSATLWVIG